MFTRRKQAALTEPERPKRHVTVGERTRVDDAVRIMAPTEEHLVTIGAGTRIYRGTEILGPVTIGEDSLLNRDCYVRPQVTIGSRVAIGPFVRLITDTHDIGPSEHRAGPFRVDPITVGDGCWIGAGAIVVAGVDIGPGAVVAAGAVVTSDVPANTLVGGTPARVLRELG